MELGKGKRVRRQQMQSFQDKDVAKIYDIEEGSNYADDMSAERRGSQDSDLGGHEIKGGRETKKERREREKL
jgi:hypothetical protein